MLQRMLAMSWHRFLFVATFVLTGLLAIGIILLGIRGFALLLCGLALLLFLSHERLLARLIAWGIHKTPKAFTWSVERVLVRPRFSRAPGAWSEVVIQNWTWHNPPGFEEVSGQKGYILQIDRLTLRFNLWSVLSAVRFHHAVHVDLILVEGLRLKTERNRQGALNLWEALDLPDQDVNVSTIVQHSCRHGGLHDHDEGNSNSEGDDEPVVVHNTSGGSSSAVVRPLPEESTEATQKAAGYRVSSPLPAHTGSRNDFRVPLLMPEVPASPIGDPRRRPRWGVPLRFDIRQLMALQMELSILDLLVPNIKDRDQAHNPEGTVVRLARLALSRERLENGDRRRAGLEDGVRGVYLGELVWVLIAEVVPVALYASPSRMLKNAAIAAGFAVKQAGVHMAVRLVELARHAGHKLNSLGDRKRPHLDDKACRVQVHLIAGRQVTRKGKSVNVHALLELHNPTLNHLPQGGVVDWCRSESQLLTKAPKWDEVFELGPASSVTSSLRIACFHRKSVDVIGLAHHKESKDSPVRYIGEVLLPLTALLIRDKVIETGGEIVGWFPLTDPHHLTGTTHCTGQLKLGLRVVNRHALSDFHSASFDEGGNEGDYVVLE